MAFPYTVALSNGDEKETTTSKTRKLGTRGMTPDGRVFYWTQNGAGALAAGNVVQSKVSPGSSVHVSGLDVVGGGTTGVTTLQVTMATTPITKDQYADGYLTVDVSPGQAMYRIKSNTSAASAAEAEFTFYDNDPLREALTSGTTKVGVRENPQASVVVFPTTATGVCVGVTPISVAADAYFWAQTWGPALVDTDAAPVAGDNVIVPGASAGSVNVASSTVGEGKDQIVGVAQTAGAGADAYNYVFLTIRA